MINATEGYGICASDLTHPLKMDHLLELIKQAPKMYARMKQNFDEDWNLKLEDCEVYDVLVEWVLLHGSIPRGGLASIMQEVIEEKENIHCDVIEDFEGYSYLVFCPQYPWMQFTEAEKDLTEERLKEIITKYLSIVTPEALYPDYLVIKTN